MARIELKNISKTYPNKVEAVKNVSFTANDGEFIVLVGPSGCGKTTILRMIAGLEEITTGELLFDALLVNDVEPKNRDVGMVFQEYALYPHLTVFENIAFPLKVKNKENKFNKKQINDIVVKVAEQTDLVDLLKRKPKELSGGQRQRVALGRAIVRQPRFFLFDEPLSNLDAKLRVLMRQEILSLQRKLGITSIYVTHDQTEAMTMGSKIAVIKDGELQQFGTPEEVYNNPVNTFVADFIGTPHINLFNCFFKDFTFFENNSDFFVDGKSFLRNKQMIADKNYTLGIRPENIFVGQNENNYDNYDNYDDNNGAINFGITIDNVEFLGNEQIIYFTTGATQKRIRTTEKLKFAINDKITCHFHYKDFLIFDENGNRI